MPAKMKNIALIFLLFLISQSLLGDIRLRTPYPNSNDNQTNSQPYLSYSPFEETKSINDAARQGAFDLPVYRPINNAIIQTYSSYIPFEERLSAVSSQEAQTFNPTNKLNAPFAPPTEGMPINDAILPLLIFSFIYLIVKLILKIKAQRI